MMLDLAPANVRSGNSRVMHIEMLGIYLGQKRLGSTMLVGDSSLTPWLELSRNLKCQKRAYPQIHSYLSREHQ